MIDLHTHIIPNIDDGSRSVEDSIRIAREAKENGFSAIFCTSHYLEHSYNVEKEENDKLFNELKKQLDIDIYSGNEIYISPNILECIEEGKVQTLNDSKYILTELPMENSVPYLKDVIFKLVSKGYIPIIAHPERYQFVQKDYKSLIELTKMGVLFQMNYGSIVGVYGRKAKKSAKILLKNDLIHFLGTDTHRADFIYNDIEKIKKKITKIIGEEKFIELSETNARPIIESIV